jgi:hypothetical protein
MPMIEAKVTMELPAEKRDVLKAEFGKAISIMGKPESYLILIWLINRISTLAERSLIKALMLR